MKLRLIAVSIGLQSALLLLAFSVFAWGVEAKLSLYKVSSSSGVPVVAKLCTDRHSSDLKASITQLATASPRWEGQTVLLFDTVSASSRRDLQVEQVKARSSRLANRKVLKRQVLHRPPPAVI